MLRHQNFDISSADTRRLDKDQTPFFPQAIPANPIEFQTRPLNKSGAVGNDIRALAARTGGSVQQELNRIFGKVELEGLPDIVAALDSLLTSIFDSLIRQHPHVLDPSCSYLAESGQFKINREHFNLRVTQAVIEPDVLEIALLPVGRILNSEQYAGTNWKLTDSGQYRKVRISAPSETNYSPESIALVAEAVYGTGYRWVEETAKEVVSRETSSAGHELYRMLRELLSDSSLAEEVWFVAFAGGKGCYLLDREPTDRAITKLSAGMAGASDSPLSLATKLFTTVLTYAEAHSRHAIESNSCINISLEESAYSENKALFLQAEKVIFGSSDISIFPILSAEAGQMVAVFPTQHRAFLEPFLEVNKEAIGERFLLAKRRFKRLLAALREPRRALAYGKVGEFVGGVLKSIFMDP